MKIISALIMIVLILPLSSEAKGHRPRPKPSDSETIDGVSQEKIFRKGRRRGRVGNERSEYSSEIQIGEPQLNGGGCPSGTSSITLSPDKKELSILFDDFATVVGGDSGRRQDVKRCRITLPLQVPRGMQVAILAVDYRGYNLLPQSGKTVLRAGHFFQDQQGQKIVRKVEFDGPLDDEFLVSSEVESGTIWSKCGKNTQMGFVTTLKTKTNQEMAEAMSTVDSMDIVGRRRSGETLMYHLMWQRCEQGPKRGHRGNRGRGN